MGFGNLDGPVLAQKGEGMLQLFQAVGQERVDLETARMLHSVVTVSGSLTDLPVSVMRRFFDMRCGDLKGPDERREDEGFAVTDYCACTSGTEGINVIAACVLETTISSLDAYN